MTLRRVEPETGVFIEDVELATPPILADGTLDPAYIKMPVPPDAGFYWPRFDFETGEWVEGRTAEEIAAILASQPTPEPTPEEAWKLGIEAALIELAGLVAGGV